MPLKEQPEWRQWMRDFGAQQRRLRETLGLSQERLAALSGVSQGAVSRLESGRGLATPLLVVLRLDLALARQMRKLDPNALNPNLLKRIELLERISPPIEGVGDDIEPFFLDPSVRELFELLRMVPQRDRARLLAVVRATAKAISGDDPANGSESS